jgi:hypothetical protein
VDGRIWAVVTLAWTAAAAVGDFPRASSKKAFCAAERVASDGFGAPVGGTMGGRLERIGFKGAARFVVNQTLPSEPLWLAAG